MRSVITELLSTKDLQKVADLGQNWSPVLWQHARLEVQMHGVAALLYKRFLDNGSLHLLDYSFQEYIKNQYLLNSKRIEKVQGVIQSILLESNAYNIDVMPLKGSILINGYYQDQAVRSMADIDLLIHDADEARMEEVLTSLGYYLKEDTSRHKSYASNDQVTSIIGEHPDNPISIDLHTNVSCKINREEFDYTEYMWNSADEGFLNFRSAKKPSMSMLLVNLLLHASDHQYEGTLRAIQLYDIYIVTNYFKHSDWMVFEELVDAMGCEKMVYLPLFLSAGCFEISVPDSLMNKIRSKTPNSVRKLENKYSLSAFIAINETLTLNYLIRRIPISLHKKILLQTGTLLSKSFIRSIELAYCSSRKEKVRESMSLLIPPPYRIDNYGYIIGAFISFLFFLAITLLKHHGLNRLRKIVIGRLKLLLFRQEFKHGTSMIHFKGT